MSETTTIRVDAEIASRLKQLCVENHWPAGKVVKRLLERFLDGHFSGSHADVIREDAPPEFAAPGKIVGEENDPENQILTVQFYYGR